MNDIMIFYLIVAILVLALSIVAYPSLRERSKKGS
ncbi:MAG: hypothetical protein CEO21_188 [Microgenomates group bacterium Gr01-1014_80]|nr:MAG: hypothetical protein CEO21_188 [Microgenomates group bacterium Gr01-1014_80]